MRNILTKINWKKVAKVGACVVSGVMAFSEAIGEQKKAEKFKKLEKRLSELEGKKS